jgi:type I restriction-modification system DNA methylase subunit
MYLKHQNHNQHHHLAGKVYEYFIGRDETAISSLGAYFTDRWISKFIIDVLIKNKKITVDKKGLIKSFCDPFGGSGGFTLTYIQELIKFAEENKIKINWDDEIKKLSHCDISNNVIRMVKLEIFTLTHSFADENKVKKTNSFTNEFTDKYDLILSNPPYGGDKKEEKLLIQKCSNLIKNYAQKELDISKIKTDTKTGVVKNYPLGGDNKENAGCLLFLSMLADKGVCVAVLKEGLFFDSKFEKLRKEMIENYNVFKVVDIPADAFENTTTKTSILFLEKTGKTDKVVFSKLCADKKSDGEITGVHEEFIDTRSKKEVDEKMSELGKTIDNHIKAKEAEIMSL